MNETLTLALAWLAGGLLGAVFFGGLWWTVRKSIASPQPALWIFGSLLVRMSVALTGFYFVAGSHWERMMVCLLGFVMVRAGILWLARPSVVHPSHRTPEVKHAP